MHVECLLPVNLSLVTLLSLEQCLQFERFSTYLHIALGGTKTASRNHFPEQKRMHSFWVSTCK